MQVYVIWARMGRRVLAHACVCVCVCACVFMHWQVRTRACRCADALHASLYTYIHIYTHPQDYILTYIHIYISPHTYLYAYIHIPTYLPIYIYTHPHKITYGMHAGKYQKRPTRGLYDAAKEAYWHTCKPFSLRLGEIKPTPT